MAGIGGSLVSWVIESWTRTVASNGIWLLVAWAMKSWTLTAAGNGIGSLVAWAMDSPHLLTVLTDGCVTVRYIVSQA